MSQAALYIIRTDAGATIRGARLVGRAGDERFDAPPRVPDEPPTGAVEALADWVKERLASRGERLAAVITDPSGAAVSWVTTAKPTPELVAATLREREAAEDEIGGGGQGRFPAPPEGASYTPVVTPGVAQASERIKVPVLGMSDAVIRLTLDALDRRGLRPTGVMSVWHAAAAAWDPEAHAAPTGEFVGQAPVHAVVIVDNAGRVTWSWAEQGQLLAAGALRVAHDRAGHPVLDSGTVGRLTSEWFAWSAHTGTAPTRATVVCGLTGEGSLTAERFRAALSASMPDVTLDLHDEPDPMLATLSRTARLGDLRFDDPRAGLPGLTNRPGAAHRAMYRWSAASLCGLAAVLFVVAFILLSRAASLQSQSVEARAATRELSFNAVESFGQTRPTSISQAQLLIADRKAALEQPAVTVASPKPILEELETLSLVLGRSEVTLRTLDLSSLAPSLSITVPDTQTFETMSGELLNIRSAVDWGVPRFNTQRDNTIRLDATGRWRDPEPRAAGEPAPAEAPPTQPPPETGGPL